MDQKNFDPGPKFFFLVHIRFLSGFLIKLILIESQKYFDFGPKYDQTLVIVRKSLNQNPKNFDSQPKYFGLCNQNFSEPKLTFYLVQSIKIFSTKNSFEPTLNMDQYFFEFGPINNQKRIKCWIFFTGVQDRIILDRKEE